MADNNNDLSRFSATADGVRMVGKLVRVRYLMTPEEIEDNRLNEEAISEACRLLGEAGDDDE